MKLQSIKKKSKLAYLKNVWPTLLLFVGFFIFEIAYMVIIYKFHTQMYKFSFLGNKTSLWVVYGTGLIISLGLLGFYFFVRKNPEEKSLFIKLFCLLPLLNSFPLVYIDIWDSLKNNKYELFQIPQIFFVPSLCNINMYLIIYLCFGKKKNAIYGSLAYFFIFTGIAGGLINSIGFPFTNTLNPDDSHPAILYKLFANEYTHISLWCIAIIAIKEKWAKFNLVNVLWFTFYLFLTFLWGFWELKVFGDSDGTVFGGNPGMYIAYGMLGQDDKIFRIYTIYSIGIVACFFISLTYELTLMPKKERFYSKKFNILDTYWK